MNDNATSTIPAPYVLGYPAEDAYTAQLDRISYGTHSQADEALEHITENRLAEQCAIEVMGVFFDDQNSPASKWEHNTRPAREAEYAKELVAFAEAQYEERGFAL